MTQIPDYIEPITAYRIWRARWKHSELFSLSMEYTWPKRPESAVCTPSRPLPWGVFGTLPEQECLGSRKKFDECYGTCGFYSLKTLSELINFVSCNWKWLRFTGDLIMGKVFLWGRIYEYDAGYRAQYAYPETIWDNRAVPQYLVGRAQETSIEDIAATYNIEISKMPGPLFNQLPRR